MRTHIPFKKHESLRKGIIIIRTIEFSSDSNSFDALLTHWVRLTHICVSTLTITGSGNGLSTDRRRPIIWINAGILLIGPIGTIISEILIDIHTFYFTKMHLNRSSLKRWPSCLGLNVLRTKRFAPGYDWCPILAITLRTIHCLILIEPDFELGYLAQVCMHTILIIVYTIICHLA